MTANHLAGAASPAAPTPVPTAFGAYAGASLDSAHTPRGTEIPNLEGRALTVLGPVDPAVLGQTLMHEHVFIDIRRPAHNRRPGHEHPEAQLPLTLENLAWVRNGHTIEDNDLLVDHREMCEAVLDFRHAGGGTIVEVSSIGLGRDPRALKRLSQATGLHVVMGAGWYEKNFHPADMDERTVDELADEIVRDIVLGVEGSGVRSGVIGEVGIEGNPLRANEITSTRATGRASARTGCPISFHVGGFMEEKFDVIDIVESEGVDPSNIVMGHSGSLIGNLPFARRVLERGVFVEFDYLGAPGSPGGTLGQRTDFVVAEGIAELVADGHEDRIVLAHDVCTKLQLKPYGGTGFDYISLHFLPVLRSLGVSETAIRKIMIDNPAKALAFHAPKQP